MGEDTVYVIEYMTRRKGGWRGMYCKHSDGTIISKTCSFCRSLLPVADFNRDSGKKSGLASACRDCMRRYNKQWASSTDQDGVTRASTIYHARKNKNRSRCSDQVFADRQRLRPMGVKQCTKCRTVKNLDEFYESKNYEDGLQYSCKDCIIEKNYEYINYWVSHGIPLICYVCGGDFEHSDHVVPSVLGGADRPENRLPMCSYHNISKNGTPLRKWLRDNYPEDAVSILRSVLSLGASPWTCLDSQEDVDMIMEEMAKI